jgi:hypothetical protein
MNIWALERAGRAALACAGGRRRCCLGLPGSARVACCVASPLLRLRARSTEERDSSGSRTASRFCGTLQKGRRRPLRCGASEALLAAVVCREGLGAGPHFNGVSLF